MALNRAKQRRTTRRLAYIRLQNPHALSGIKADNHYTPRQFRRVKRTSARVHHQVARQQRRQSQRQQEYNPLAPLTGKEFTREERASERAQFAGPQHQLKQDIGAATQTVADTGSYYDDYRKALSDATARINAANQAAITASQQHTDAAYAQDTAGLQARTAADAAEAAKFGRPAPSEAAAAGAQAISAERSQENQSLGTERAQAADDTKLMENRGATAVLAKAEAIGRKQSELDKLRSQMRDLKQQRADYKVKFRSDTRSDERTYALARKEFGLKKFEAQTDRSYKQSLARQKKQAQNAQKIVARIYASADKAKARVQIRVAKLQLQKGKIDQKQYRRIVNIYHGLPKKGVASQPKGSGSNGSTRGAGSGANGSLAPWERDKINEARNQFNGANLHPADKAKAIRTAEQHGVPARLARIAWAQYIKRNFGTVNYGGPH